MRKHNLRLSFPIMESELPRISVIMSGLEGLSRHEIPRSRRAGYINLELVRQYPMIVEVNEERWLAVDRVSVDRAIVILNLREAVLPDSILERLPVYDEHVRAAQWAVANNSWSIEMKRF